jgi:hypothetical protein
MYGIARYSLILNIGCYQGKKRTVDRTNLRKEEKKECMNRGIRS